MRIADLRATTVSVPLHAPLRHANGCHWGRFVRTIVEVETDNGLVTGNFCRGLVGSVLIDPYS
jgi:glucarate dehydratase